jgi:pimeloyl-ACP methyl ester carboxylesterase
VAAGIRLRHAEHLLKLRAGELELSYRETGSGDPVLLVNGTGESSASWNTLATRLGARYHVVSYDARDTGDSSYAGAPYTPRDLAADAAAIIDGLALGRAHVIGYSLGGATAQELAIARSELVRSMVLLSTWARSDGWFIAQMRNWQTLRRAHAEEHEFLRALAVWLFSPATFARDPEPWRVYLTFEETAQQAEGWIRQTEADIAHDASARLGSVDVPALVIVGEDDICTPARYSRELCALLPFASLVMVPDAGHAAVLEQPDMVAHAIEEFLAEVP